MDKIILERIAQQNMNRVNDLIKTLDLITFGTDWPLYDFQIEALKNIISILNLFYQDGNPNPDNLINAYHESGFHDFEQIFGVKKEDSHFELLSKYYPVLTNQIDYRCFINRASFWMATGSGKTLVMIKLIEVLCQFINQGRIPANNILILAPKDEILSQIEEHIAKFNVTSQFQIDLVDLREFGKPNYQTNIFPNKMNIYYYRSDNITGDDKVKLIDFENYQNDGKWYVLLDEAHKGDKSESIRQQYYKIFSRNGFLFNFSATFTDEIDKVTTVLNYNLRKFITAGYGKQIKVMDEELKNFKKSDKEFAESDQIKRVLQAILTYTVIRKTALEIKSINPILYHNPLMVVIANEVHTPEADLKIFFNLLNLVAEGSFDLDTAKNELISSVNSKKSYYFNTGEIPNEFINQMQSLTKDDIFKVVFKASGPGKIEYTRIVGNDREIAFRHKNAAQGSHFCLLYTSKPYSWETSVIKDFDQLHTVTTKSYFDKINEPDSEINILLGSRIFVEGWDSNRPNVMCFVNMGVSEEATILVPQATGRGVRIEPYPHIRKRLEYFNSEERQKVYENCNKTALQTYIDSKKNEINESLFIFATNKEVVKKLLEMLDKGSDKDWSYIKSIKKNESLPDELYIFAYGHMDFELPNYVIAKVEKDELLQYIGASNNDHDKIILMNTPSNHIKTIVDTISIIRETDRIATNGNARSSHPMENLLKLDSYFHQKVDLSPKPKKITTEIRHFEQVQVANVNENELEKIEHTIMGIIEAKYKSMDQLVIDLQDKKITKEEFIREQDILNNSSEFRKNEVSFKYYKDFLKEHYYKPILIPNDSFEEFMKHVIKEKSEKDFINALVSNRKILDENFDWWYFSKIEEVTDDVSIPYFNSEEQEYKNFYPDFIFWLKKGKAYYIKFVDPKGIRAGWVNAEDKAKGFKIVFNKSMVIDKNPLKVSLYYYNDNIGDNQVLKEITTKDFSKIFQI